MAEIRFRGERRLGELMAAQREAGLLHRGGGDHRVAEKPGAPIALAEVGIDKVLADRARNFAATVTLASVTLRSSVTEKADEINGRGT